MTLDKVTDKRTELFNACLHRLYGNINAQNDQINQMVEKVGNDYASQFSKRDLDQGNLNLMQNTLQLISNLIDGLIKPEDSNLVNLNV
jgi:uncharacterized protein (DUF3820 family)